MVMCAYLPPVNLLQTFKGTLTIPLVSVSFLSVGGTKLKIMNWTKLEVYNNEQYLGSFYTDETTKQGIIREINEKYGQGNWTKYNIGN